MQRIEYTAADIPRLLYRIEEYEKELRARGLVHVIRRVNREVTR